MAVFLTEGGRTFAPALNFNVGADTDFLDVAPPYSPRTGDSLGAIGENSTETVVLYFGADGSLENRISASLEHHPDGSPVIGNFNNNGFNDIAYAVGPGEPVVVQFGPATNPSPAPQDPAPLPQAAPVVVDWNGDKIPDVFDLNEQGGLLLRLGQPGSPGEYESPEVIGGNLGVSFSDITLVTTRNGPVLAAIEEESPVIWLFSPGPGATTVARSIAVPNAGFLVSITTGDLNSDGLDDLVVVDRGNDQLILLYQSADGSFAKEGAPLAVGYAPSDVAIADLNQSGWADLVVSNTYSGDLSVFYGGPGGQFGPEVLLAAGLGAASAVPQNGSLHPAHSRRADRRDHRRLRLVRPR